jgi:hypothetical protein
MTAMKSIILLLCVAAAGCAPAMDRITATDFEPTGNDGFKFRTMIAPQYPDNAMGETARMDMLQGWLTNNSMCPRGYDITSRQAVQRSVFVSDVFYNGRCKA